MTPAKGHHHRWIALLAILFFSTTARATAGESPWYLEGRIGQTALDGEIALSGLDWRVDDEDTSAGIDVGYTINPYLAIQAGYRDMGAYPATPPPCDLCELDERLFVPLEVDAVGLSLAAVPRWPIGDRFSLYGKLGVFRWELDVNLALRGDRVARASGEELLVAGGAHFGFSSGFGVLVEYEVVSGLFDGANLGFSWRF